MVPGDILRVLFYIFLMFLRGCCHYSYRFLQHAWLNKVFLSLLRVHCFPLTNHDCLRYSSFFCFPMTNSSLKKVLVPSGNWPLFPYLEWFDRSRVVLCCGSVVSNSELWRQKAYYSIFSSHLFFKVLIRFFNRCLENFPCW